MNQPFDQLPGQCEVLVVGAGPAGSAAATLLARGGREVVLVDQRAFPRDKVCGDALIPDAHAALKRLGVFDEVMARAQRVHHVACIGPGGGRLEVPGELAVLPRRELDAIVCGNAVRAGVRMHAPAAYEAPLHDDAGRVAGALLSHDAARHELRAAWTVLATGAVPEPLVAAGMCTQQSPDGVALRAYVENPAVLALITELEIVWDRRLRPGYGWIFPCGGGMFNIGVGITDSHRRDRHGRSAMPDVNLREIFQRFCEFHAPARELMRGGTMSGPLKGAPLRFTLRGAHHSRPGLLVAGEAGGSTYSFTGEGIGKAMETGLLAAEALLGAAPAETHLAACERYEATLRGLQPRFDLYERANRVNAHPWLMDLVLWRARKSARLLQRMSGVLNETSNPGNLFSVSGLTRLFTE
jgi:geranylgeranyl reductase family protein